PWLGLEEVHHVFAAMIGVAQEALSDRVDDEVERFEGKLADENGAIVGKFGDLHGAFALLHRESDRLVHVELDRTAAGASFAFAKRLQAQSLDEMSRHG